MRLEDMRRSENVEDRRGMGVGRTGAGIGIGTIVLLIVGYFMGVSPSTLLSLLGAGEAVTQGSAASSQTAPAGAPTDPQGDFAAAVLGETEDVWTKYFAASGQRYEPPTLVLFTDQVASACGMASAAAGPFYCPGDQKLYIDLGFFNQLSSEFGAPGDFARAYVIAHEVGHHIQNLLGITEKSERLSAQQGESGAKRVSVEVELQADCYAGVWAMQAQRVIEPGELQQALQAAAAVGDDTLQRRSQGRVVPETFTHGSAAQRQRWFQRGFDGGKLQSCDTFSAGSQL
jgi:predicted metalloprotease